MPRECAECKNYLKMAGCENLADSLLFAVFVTDNVDYYLFVFEQNKTKYNNNCYS